MEAPLPEIRIGDRERREVDDRLQAALTDGVLTLSEYDERLKECWAAAHTRSDLDALTRDLPEPHRPDAVDVARPAPAVPTAAAPVRARRQGRVAGRLFAVLLVLAATWGLRVIGADDGASVFTSRVVQVGGTQGRVQVSTLFGSTRVQVPDGVRVRTSGTVILGSVNCDDACLVPAGAREIVVEANGCFGSVNVVTSAEVAADRVEEVADDARDG